MTGAFFVPTPHPFLSFGKMWSHSKTSLEIIPAPSGNWMLQCEFVCETVRKRIPPDLVRTASVRKLNRKCEEQDESERIYEARTLLINSIFVMFFLKFNSNQPKFHHN